MVEYTYVREYNLDSCKIWDILNFNNSCDQIICQLISLTEYIAAVVKTWSLLSSFREGQEAFSIFKKKINISRVYSYLNSRFNLLATDFFFKF